MFTKTIYKMVEVPSMAPLPELTEDLKNSLRSLQGHPALQYMLQRLALERAGLQTALNNGFQLDSGAVKHLQAAIYYAGWLERELKRLTQTPSAPVREPIGAERELFDRQMEALELLK